MLPADALPVADKVMHPDWAVADGWADQIPDNLRRIWDSLSTESKLIAAIVGAEGIQPPWDID